MPTAKAVPSTAHLKAVPPIASGAEGKFRVLFEQASDAILILGADGLIDEINHAFEELTGFVRDELIGQKPSDLFPTHAQAQTMGRAREMNGELIQISGTHEDIVIRQKDGIVRLVELTIRPVEMGQELLSMVLFRDVTEKKRMEREVLTKHSELRNAYVQLEKTNADLKAMQETLVQAGKMAALGELAAGIAHELNQPLQGIRGYAQELQATLTGASEEAQTFLKEIISNADKMAQIIQYLRTFTRKSVEDLEWVDLHTAVEEAFKMLSRQFHSRGIQIHREFAKDLPKLYANPLQLEQVFINLSTNARDAIEASGRGTGNIWIRTRADGDFIEVTFRDDGAGMNERTKAKVFNPFFTTKEVGKGMGLGLSLSYGILTKIHASIVVESELGKGAQFVLRIPKDFRAIG
jgi:PAS domain S-box-containing protein